MAMTPIPAFAQTPKTAPALLTAAVASLATTTPTNVVAAFTAGPNGAIVTRITVTPRGSVTATALYLFKSTDGGVSQHFKDSVTVATQIPAATGGITKTYFTDYTETRPMRLGAGDIISFGLGVTQANGIEVDVEYTNF